MTAVIHSERAHAATRFAASAASPYWGIHEEKKLRRLYPGAPKPEICDNLPGRTWGAIVQRAARLKIERLEHVTRSEHIHPVVHALVDRRVALGLRIGAAARKIGWPPRTLGALERGRRIPTLPMLDAWAAVLGVELAIVTAAHCASESATNQE